MAILHVTEFAGQARNEANSEYPAARTPPLADQKVSYTTSAQSSAFNASARMIRVYAPADVYVEFGSNPTATTSSMLIASGTTEYFGVLPGGKLAAYDGSS